MKSAVVYARVSGKEQEQGFSLEAQTKIARTYAATKGLSIVKEFSYSESAKRQGRKHFNLMLQYLREHPDVRTVIVEKTDRLLRNLEDYVLVEQLVEEMGLEIHLVKEGQILQRNTRSQDKLVQGLFALLARNYIQNMQEEILKGQLVKAGKGQYPGRAPHGYMHDRELRIIVSHPHRAPVVKLLFELFASGQFTLTSVRKALIEKTGERLSKSYLNKMLRSRFYIGLFSWRGREYQGIHPRLIDPATFERVQSIMSRRGKAKTRKHDFPFSNLLTCADDGCAITAEQHKGKYTYYHCSFGKGKHPVTYLTENVVGEMLARCLDQMRIPEDVASAISTESEQDLSAHETRRRKEVSMLQQRLSALQTRRRRAYADKLDGLIDDSFWRDNTSGWATDEDQIQASLAEHSCPIIDEGCLTVERILELADRAKILFLNQNNAERAKLMKMLLDKCPTAGSHIFPQYREPFVRLFQAPEPGSLPS